MFSKDILKVIVTCLFIMTILVLVMSFKDKLIKSENTDDTNTLDMVEYTPDEDYYTNKEVIDTGYNVNDYRSIELVNIDITSLDDISYILAESFCIGLQAFCDDNDITELFTPVKIYAGPNNNITKLDVESNNYKLTLSYDVTTDYVEIVETE